MNIYTTHMETMEQQEKLKSILDNSNTIVYMKDRKGNYLLVNRQFEKIYGVDRSAVYGKSNFELFSDEISKKSCNSDQFVLDNQHAMQFEEVIKYGVEVYTY